MLIDDFQDFLSLFAKRDGASPLPLDEISFRMTALFQGLKQELKKGVVDEQLDAHLNQMYERVCSEIQLLCEQGKCKEENLQALCASPSSFTRAQNEILTQLDQFINELSVYATKDVKHRTEKVAKKMHTHKHLKKDKWLKP